MHEQPSNPNQKEEILSRSPHLRAFLNPIEPLDPLSWIPDLESTREPIIRLLEKKLGQQWVLGTIAPLMIYAHFSEVFHPSPEPQVRLGIVEQLVLLGHEIGSYEDIEIFTDDIIEQIELMNRVAPEPILNKENPRLKNEIKGILAVGAYYRMIDGNEPSTSGDDPLQPFRDFINNPEFGQN